MSATISLVVNHEIDVKTFGDMRFSHHIDYITFRNNDLLKINSHQKERKKFNEIIKKLV
jgi:hypothetical protein